MIRDIRVMNNTDQCVANIGNRYDLILVASERVRELRRGHKPKFATTSTPCVAALEEIEAGPVGRDYLKKIK
jgi:DNA-directed RNA polymerase omega subunit